MNIAFLIPQVYDPTAGGVQRSTSKLAKIFKKHKHKCIVISLNNKQEDMVIDGVSVFSVTRNVSIDKSKFKELCKSHRIQLVINQAGFSLSKTKLLLKLQNDQENQYKIINTLRINPLNFIDNHKQIIRQFLQDKGLSFLDSRILRFIILKYHYLKQSYELNFIIKHVDAFVMLSERFKTELYHISPKLRTHESKIFGINNPFPLIDEASISEKKDNVILYVGRLNIQQKRTDLLLKIWKSLHHQLPDWEYWVAGHGPERNSMIKYCNKHQLDRVKFFGQCDPNPLYQKAKILHMTSAFEGFGNVLVEAQSHAVVPVMFNSYSAAQDIVIDEQTGFLVKPFDIKAYTQKTLELTQNENNLKRLSKQAYDHSQNFSYENTYKKWEKVFSII